MAHLIISKECSGGSDNKMSYQGPEDKCEPKAHIHIENHVYYYIRDHWLTQIHMHNVFCISRCGPVLNLALGIFICYVFQFLVSGFKETGLKRRKPKGTLTFEGGEVVVEEMDVACG